MELVLASASPRRSRMLQDLGLKFSVFHPNINESRFQGERPAEYVRRLAAQKAGAAAASLPGPKAARVIVAADTIVVSGALVLGKPKSARNACQMLARLSGKTHEVITAYCWLGFVEKKTVSIVRHVRTKVTFAERSADFWKWYVSTGEPMDKAGAYAAQGIGVSFIEKVSGSYSNVVGLPLAQALDTFKEVFGKDLRECCAKRR